MVTKAENEPIDPTTRFTGRVDDYVKTRPAYPEAVLTVLRESCARGPANVALVWNDRDLGVTPFLRDYEQLLLARCPKYRELQGKADAVDRFDALFGAGQWQRHAVPNEQRLDREGLVGRLLSSSYAPKLWRDAAPSGVSRRRDRPRER